MTLAATGTLDMEAKVQYLHTLSFGEELLQFDLLYNEMKNMGTPLDVNSLPKGLAWYSPL